MSVHVLHNLNNVTIFIAGILIPGDSDFHQFENIVKEIKLFKADITIDLSQCNYMDSRAISTILDMYRELHKIGKHISILRANEEILDLFRTIKLDRIIEIQ